MILLALTGAAVVVAFRLAPAVWSIVLSLQDAFLLRSGASFHGLANYRQLAGDPRFWLSLRVSAFYVAGTALPAAVAGLALAAFLRTPGLWTTLLRAGFVLPSVLPGVVSATVWRWLYDPYDGLINGALALAGVTGPAWLKDPQWALPALILMGIWKETGLNLLIYLAALAGLPEELDDAARVDGAGAIQLWSFVRLPLLLPATGVVLLTGVLRSFDLFAPVLVMTGGGPAGATTSWTYYLYTTAFEHYRIGYASAGAVAAGAVASLLLVSARRCARGFGP